MSLVLSLHLQHLFRATPHNNMALRVMWASTPLHLTLPEEHQLDCTTMLAGFSNKYTHTCFIVRGGELVQHFSIHIQDLLLQDGGIREAAPLLSFSFLSVFVSVSLSLPCVDQQLLA